jgi:hypothetical protein
MSGNGIAKASDFRAAVEHASAERVVLPASGLTVLLCRPPVFAALRMGREGTQLQSKITDSKPEDISPEDVIAFSDWLGATLSRLFVQPRFSNQPEPNEIGLGEILVDDLQFIFRWLRGEVFNPGARGSGLGAGESPSTQHLAPGACTEDLTPFPRQPREAAVSGRGGEAFQLPAERTPGDHRDAGVSAGLHRR